VLTVPWVLCCRGADYQALVDEICMHSAATGKVIGFDGQALQVSKVITKLIVPDSYPIDCAQRTVEPVLTSCGCNFCCAVWVASNVCCLG
jgi:hypothetical protein